MKSKLGLSFWIHIALLVGLLILGNINPFLRAQIPISNLDSLHKALKQTNNIQSKIDIYNEIADFHLQQSDSVNIFHYAQLARDLSKQHNYWEGLSQAHQTIAIFYFNNKTNDSLALYHFNEVLHAAKQRKDFDLQAETYKRIGVIYRWKANYNLSLQNHQLALQLYKNLENPEGIALVQNNIANVHSNLGNYTLALDYMLKSLKYWEVTNNHQLIGTISNNVGIIFLLQKDHQGALSYFFKSITMMDSLNNQPRVASASNNIGTTFQELEDYNKAHFYYQKALTIYKKLEDDYGIARVLHNLGEFYRITKKYDKALLHLEQALEIRKQLDTNYGIASTMIEMGEVYRYLKNYEQAELFLIQGKELAQQIGRLDKVQTALGFLAKLYYNQGQYEKAYQSQLLFSQLSDSLLNAESIRRTTLMNANYQFQQKSDSLQQVQNQEKEVFNSRQTQYHWWITLLAMSVLISLLTISILINRQKSKRKQSIQSIELQKIKQQLLQEKLQRKEIQEEVLQQQLKEDQQTQSQLQLNLENKDFELTRQALYLLQKQQLLDKIGEEIKEIAKSGAKPIQDRLKGLVRMIRKESNTVEKWQNFTQTFEMAHPGFFHRLQQRFPELTDYDLKLSALLRLGFDSRELALILNITTDSVRKARTRLRKKLQLQEEGLGEFMRDL